MTTPKEQAFVEHYLRLWDGAKAARAANYAEKSARVTASRLLKKPHIQAAIKARMDELKASADEVIVGLTEHKRGTMEDFVSLNASGEPYIDLEKAINANKLHLVKKLKITRKTGNTNEFTTEIELYDAQAASVALGKHHRLFADKIEVDWAAELTGAGLDANAVEDELTRLFKQHLLGGAAKAAGDSLEEGEAPG